MNIAEQKAKIREIRYNAAGAIAVLGPPLSAALYAGGLDKWAALGVAVLSLMTGGGAALVAGKTVKGQRVDGVFADPEPDPEPEPAPPVPPLQQVLNAAPQVVEAYSTARADLKQLQDGLTDALGKIPVVGPELGKLGKQVGELIP